MEATVWRRADRRIAGVAASVLATVLVVASAFSDPPEEVVRHDPRAADDLVALMQAGERLEYVVEYRFERIRVDGARLEATTYEARGPNITVSRTESTLTIESPSARYVCEIVADGPGCRRSSPAERLAPGEVVRTVVDLGVYKVARLDDATIAGQRARCFLIATRSRTKRLPNLGVETETCLASDGLLLRERVYSDRLDGREAVGVVRAFDSTALEPVLAGYEAAIPDIDG